MSVPRTEGKSWLTQPCTPVTLGLGVWRQEDPCGLLATSLLAIGSVRGPVAKSKVGDKQGTRSPALPPQARAHALTLDVCVGPGGDGDRLIPNF